MLTVGGALPPPDDSNTSEDNLIPHRGGATGRPELRVPAHRIANGVHEAIEDSVEVGALQSDALVMDLRRGNGE